MWTENGSPSMLASFTMLRFQSSPNPSLSRDEGCTESVGSLDAQDIILFDVNQLTRLLLNLPGFI